MCKTWTPARTKVPCQECQVQRLPEKWIFPQSVPEQEKSHPASQPCSEPPRWLWHPHWWKWSQTTHPPPRVNMLKMVNHIEANRGKFNEEKHLKFPIVSHLKGPYNHHIVIRVDTRTGVNCMNEKTFNEIFPEMQLSVWPHEIQNLGNSVADISILGQFHSYLEFRGEKYLNIVTDANDCPNLLSHGATFWDGCTALKLPQGHGCWRRKCASFQQNEWRQNEDTPQWYIKCIPDIWWHMEITASST